ncbi:hypothetical protein MPK66_gp296 [Erwinia phage pEa_SNUABM_2]|uniref:Uncharacterized protein n=1 Tax=Erwinia phage pEa_SNUABM_2 TaxID=2869547 RepID=A0AAE7XPQ2_9CAUD|nr:hypothetical protein MPK66_gp296 [Erwinia phage pEa_SNUABM_2]QZE59540.1 hypothetical protein pEaSNUABM2_00296 [Erwinia phage pEa_SNUABM_2]QZE59877.1 hypothetical protein pEaSNUABM39_00297 [Erwinia phage pEa_SNUABM_39]
MTEDRMNIEHIRSVTKEVFKKGTVQQRDALRSIANKVLAPSVMFACEDTAPDVETAYRLLEDIKFSGDGTQMLPADGVYALDSILNKTWREDFFSAVCNMALTMYATDPATVGKGYWPKNHNDFNRLITRAFIWVVAQHGLINLLSPRDAHVVSHTRLPQFMIATQVVGQDEGCLRHYTLYQPQQDTGSMDSYNVVPDSYIEKIRADRRANQPPEYEEAANMSFSDLADLCERLHVIGPEATFPPCKCKVEDDCECDEDEYQSREDFDEDQEELLETFYNKFGFPDDSSDEPEEEKWLEGISLMEVEVDLPTVRLPTPELNTMRNNSRMKKPHQKARREKIRLTPEQQIWHKVDTDPLSIDRRFAISLVSRHTCGVNRAVATQREAMAVAAALMEVSE